MQIGLLPCRKAEVHLICATGLGVNDWDDELLSSFALAVLKHIHKKYYKVNQKRTGNESVCYRQNAQCGCLVFAQATAKWSNLNSFNGKSWFFSCVCVNIKLHAAVVLTTMDALLGWHTLFAHPCEMERTVCNLMWILWNLTTLQALFICKPESSPKTQKSNLKWASCRVLVKICIAMALWIVIT